MKKRTLLFLFVLIIFGANFCLAAPAPDVFAINPETKECSNFWPGDEFVYYILPEGWTFYYYDFDEGTSTVKIETPFGNCTSTGNIAEECCNELGLTYILKIPGMKKTTNYFLILTNAHPTFLLVIFYGGIIAILVGLFFLIRHFVRKAKNNKLSFSKPL